MQKENTILQMFELRLLQKKECQYDSNITYIKKEVWILWIQNFSRVKKEKHMLKLAKNA